MIRHFLLGSDWVYFKVYSGVNTLERILLNEIKPFVNNLFINNIISKWFYVRYKDPEPHLRLRLLLKSTDCLSEILNELNKIFTPLVKNRLVYKFEYACYTREIERYGINNIYHTESMFHIDSTNIVNILYLIRYRPDKNNLLWRLTLHIVDSYYEMLDIDLHNRMVIVESLAKSFRKEFHLDNKDITRVINRKYKDDKLLVESVFDVKFDDELLLILENHAVEIKNILNELCFPSITEKIEYITSIIHMSINRIFKDNNRQYEMMIYEYLSRYYKSILARKKYNK